YIVIAEHLITKEREYLYIGEADTSIKIRFQRGFCSYRYYKKNNKTRRDGYKGYKWIEADFKNKKLNVFVATFPFITKTEDKSDRNLLEAVEGELVFLVREKTNKWPLYQNEIHFWNEEDKHKTIDAKKFAGIIFDNIK
ncbi:MAG TPA: hypothetical protein VF411_03445, partial [Bacteroidia bacterium]